MASNTVRVNVVANSKDFEKGFDRSTAKAAGFGAAIGTMAAQVALDLGRRALGAIKDFVSGSLTAFSNLTESTNAVEKTFGDAAESVLEIGQNSAESFGLARSEFNSAAVSFAGFAKNIAGDGGDVAGVVETLVGRATDFASVMNLEVGEAMEIFQSTLAGQSRPIRAYGLDLSDTAIQAHALATGIHDGTGEMGESEKQIARYSLLLQETEQWAGDFADTSDEVANKQRILNAELEDQRAVLGQALVPLQNTWLQIQRDALPIITELATTVGLLTGAIDKGEAALIRYQSETGDAVDTADDLIDATRRQIDANVVAAESQDRSAQATSKWVDEALNLIGSAELSREELDNLKRAYENMERQGFLTADQTAELTGAIEDQKAELDAKAWADHEIQLYKNRDAQRETGGATSDTTDEIVRQADELRAQTDPLFAAIRHAENLDEAQRELNDAIVEYGEDSREARRASAEVASENAALIGVLQKLKEDGIDPTGSAARTMLEGMGIPPGTINSLFSEFDRIERNFEGRAFDVHLSVPSFEMQQRANTITPVKSGETLLQRGGIVTEGLLDGNRSSRQEAVIPLDTQQGKQALATAIASAMGGAAGVQVFVSGSVVTEHDLVEALHRGLQEKAKRNGGLGL